MSLYFCFSPSIQESGFQKFHCICSLCLVFQLTCWLEDLQNELQSSEIADTVEGAEQLLAHFNKQRETTLDAAMNTVGEGENLLEQLR